MTTVVAGNKIFATEFNDLRNRLDDIWNDGIFDKGYGRLLDDLAPDVPDQVTAGVHVVDATRLIEFNQAMIDSGIHQGTEEEANIPSLSSLTNEGLAVANSVNIGFRADVSGDLNETYFDLYSASDERKYRVFYTNVAQETVVVGDGQSVVPVIITSNDGVTWTFRSNPLFNDHLNGVGSNGSLYVAVGSALGMEEILTSPDGITWTERSAPGNPELEAVAWSPELGLWCIVGNAGRILTSTDGITWDERSSPESGHLEDIVWASELGLFCAVGAIISGGPDGNQAHLITSPDGITWTQQTNPKGSGLWGVEWNGSIFCAAGGPDVFEVTNEYTLTSPDGITWTQRNGAIPSSITFAIAWNGSIFASLGTGGLATSPDGKNWHEEERFPINGGNDIIWDSRQFIVAVEGGIITSPNGEEWTIRSTPKPGLGHNGAISKLVLPPGDYIYALVEFTDDDSAATITTLTAAAIETASDFSNFYEIVNDFDTITLPDSTHINVTNTIKGTTLVPVDGTGSVLQSTVLPFIERSSSLATHLNDIVWSGSPTDLFVAVGNATIETMALILTSADGITWTVRSNQQDAQLFSVAVDNSGLLVAVGFNPFNIPYMLTSTDGIIWTQRSNPGIVGESLSRVAWSPTAAVGGLWVACGTSAMLMTSPDGITWTNRSHPKNEGIFGVVWSPSLDFFCAVGSVDGSAPYIITSPDGIIWTQRSTPATNRGLLTIAWSESLGVFVAGGSQTARGRAHMLQSTDGITWMEEKSLEIGFISDVYWDENTNYFWATGGIEDVIPATSYVIFSDNGYDWTKVPWFNSKPQNGTASNDTVIVIVGENDIDPSIGSNDNTFTTNFATGHALPAEADLSIAGIPDGVDGLNDLILAADNNLYENSLTTLETNRHNISTGVIDVQKIEMVEDVDVSLAGTYWNLYDEIAEEHYQVCHNVTFSVAIGFAGELMTSNDGANWIARSSGISTAYAVSWSPELSLFVAGDQNGNMISSPDGITWTPRSGVSAERIKEIVWSRELLIFCGVGYSLSADSLIITSPDGINWTEQSNPRDDFLHAVAWSPELGLFCAVGDGTPFTYIVTSPDGITWTTRSADDGSAQFRGIAWSPALGLFVTVGRFGSMLSSEDGITWTNRTHPDATESLEAITWSPELGLFCATGNNKTDPFGPTYVVTSDDGINWDERSVPSGLDSHSISWDGSQFIIGAHADIMTSPDGTTWTAFHENTPATNNINSIASTYAAPPLVLGATKIQVNLASNATLGKIAAQTKTEIEAIGGTPFSIDFTDYVWTQTTTIVGQFAFADVIWVHELQLFIAGGGVGQTYLATSPDGLFPWTTRTAFGIKGINGFAWSPKLQLVVAVAVDENGTNGIATSPDAIAWTARSGPGTQDLESVAWSPLLEMFAACGAVTASLAEIITSTDGITWTARTPPFGAFVLFDMVWGLGFLSSADAFIAVGQADGSDARILTSTDGINWFEQANPKNIQLNSITVNDDGLYCAVGNADGSDAYIVTSSNLSTWTERSNPKNFNLGTVEWLGNEFLAHGSSDGSDVYMIRSSDGVTWTEVANNNTISLSGIATGAGVVCTVGNNNGVLAEIYTSPQGIDLTLDSIGDNKLADEGTPPTGFTFTHTTEGRNIQYELTNRVLALRQDDWGQGVSGALSAISAEITQSFDTADEARYWYNSGAYIEFWMDITGGSATPQVADWNQLFLEVGTIRFNHEDTISEFMPSGEVDTAIGFYDLTTSYQTIYTSTTGSGAYTDNMFFIEAKVDVIHPNAKIITFRFEFQDFHAAFSGIPLGSDVVDGNFRIHGDDRRSIDRVIAPEPVYTLLSGGDFPD